MSRIVPRPVRRLLGILLLTPVTASAAVLTVGDGVSCQHPNIASALTALPVGGTHELRIESDFFPQQAIAISGRVLTLRGGYANCGDASPSGTSTLSGAGGSRDSVLTITGSANDVILENLGIAGGDEVDDGYGGGIDFRGSGFLTLRETSVVNNSAGYGGGVSITGSGGSAELRLEAGTTIAFNIAEISGGGIRIDGNTHLLATHERIGIFENEALGSDSGYGGGLLVVGPASADIGSPGFGSSGVINNNRARYGGGIAVVAPDEDGKDARLHLFTTNPQRPVRINANRASQTGGGIYTQSYINGVLIWSARSYVCADDFRIDGNTAQNGSAIYADTDSHADLFNGGSINLNKAGACGPPDAAGLGAVACTVGDDCSVIDGNLARTSAGAATDGATIVIQNDGDLDAERVTLRNNSGGRVLHLFSYARLFNSVVAGNATSNELIRIADGAGLTLENGTIASNAIGAAHAIYTTQDLRLRRSILWQPGKFSLQNNGGTLDVGDLLVSERLSLDGGSNATIGVRDPRFVDAAGGDFRLRAASPAVDFASTGGGVDRDGLPRGGDIAEIPDRFGAGDLGAYERQAFQPLVLNGDFDVDLHFWSGITANASSHDPAQNVSGSAGSGALRVALANVPQPRVYVRSQCVHLPVAGRYRLNGWGRSSGPIGQRDSVLLRWELRHDGQEACNAGIANHFGDHGLSASSGWLRPSAPALIDVPLGTWTPTSSIEIQLAVQDAGVTVPPDVSGWFDGIALELETAPASGLPFANGFEG